MLKKCFTPLFINRNFGTENNGAPSQQHLFHNTLLV